MKKNIMTFLIVFIALFATLTTTANAATTGILSTGFVAEHSAPIIARNFKPVTVSIYYDANGGKLRDEKKSISCAKYLSFDGVKSYSEDYALEDFNYTSLKDPSFFGLYKEGYTFVGWALVPGGYVTDQGRLVHLEKSIFVNEHSHVFTVAVAQWKPNYLVVKYNANKGVISVNPLFSSNKSGTVIEKDSQKEYSQIWLMDMPREYGLANAETFRLYRKGYVFVGWSSQPNASGLAMDPNNTKLVAQDVSKSVLNSSRTEITLYAQWMPENINVMYCVNDKKETVGNKNYSLKNGAIFDNKNNVSYVETFKYSKSAIITNKNSFDLLKPYSELIGWSTQPNGKGKVFSLGEKIPYLSVMQYLDKNTNILKLYPVWDSYAMPIDMEGEVFISSLQGRRFHPVYKEWRYHAGMDIAACYGVEIYSIEDGVVTEVGVDRGYGYGNYVKVNHGNGIESLYAHASKTTVKVGDRVKKGDLVAKVGSTGTSTGNHLHLEVRLRGQAVDPMNYIDFSSIPVKL